MSVKRNGHARAGFTLLEALVAAGVLAIGIVGMVGLQATLFHTAHFSQNMSNAAFLLQSMSEDLGTRSIASLLGPPALCAGAAPGCAAAGTWAAAPGSGCSLAVLDPVSVTTPSPGPGGPYRVDLGIVAHPDALNHPNALQATISVCWAEASGRVRQIQSVRVLGDR